MTPDERKRGLRDAVDTKTLALLEQKAEALEVLGATVIERDFLARGWQVDLLWEIIDSLVDEITLEDAVVSELVQAIAGYRKWFDTCTKTLAPNWEDRACAAINRLEKAIADVDKLASVRPADTPRFSPGDLVDYQDCRWEVISQHQYEHTLTIRSTGGTEVVTVPVDNVRPADKEAQ